MKTKLLAAIMLSSGVLAFAQTTLTKAANDPVSGNVVNNVVLNTPVDNSPVGSPVNFSNPNATAGAAVSNTYSALTATELTSFPTGTIKHDDGNGTIIYYKQNPTTLEIVGIANTTATINLTANPPTAITYPTSYLSSFSDTTSGSTSYNGTNLNLSGTVTSNAEAFGILTIGATTYPNVLKVKIVINLNITLSGFPINVGTAQNTMYLYYDNLKRYPILTSTSGSIVAPAAGVNQSFSGAQALASTFLSANDVEASKLSFSFYPNPTTDFVNFKGDLKNFDEYSIITPEGKLIKREKLKGSSIDVNDLGSGVYFINLESSKEKQSFRIIKK